MPNAIRYPANYFDGNEQRIYFTVCNANGVGCGWESPDSHYDADDCSEESCPECGCDDVTPRSEWA